MKDCQAAVFLPVPSLRQFDVVITGKFGENEAADGWFPTYNSKLKQSFEIGYLQALPGVASL